jgi:hypothetical protein
MPELIVHTSRTNQDHDVFHNIQSDNLARAKKCQRELLSLGYPPLENIRSQHGYHSFQVWSLTDLSALAQLSRRAHHEILTHVGIPPNTDTRRNLNILSTYAHVKPLRVRPSPRLSLSPVGRPAFAGD